MQFPKEYSSCRLQQMIQLDKIKRRGLDPKYIILQNNPGFHVIDVILSGTKNCAELSKNWNKWCNIMITLSSRRPSGSAPELTLSDCYTAFGHDIVQNIFIAILSYHDEQSHPHYYQHCNFDTHHSLPSWWWWLSHLMERVRVGLIVIVSLTLLSSMSM